MTKKNILFAILLLILLPISSQVGGADNNSTNNLEFNNFSDIGIETCQELQNVNNSYNYYLLQNVDCSASINWNSGQGFLPITSFERIFDGRNFSISDLYINRSSSSFIGLFSKIDGGEITNLNLINADITGDAYVGGIAGSNNGTISNSYANTIISGANTTGGLIGENRGEVSNSYTTGDVNGVISCIGGLIGL